MEVTVEYDALLECYVAVNGPKVVCLGAETLHDAEVEADSIVWDEVEGD